MGVVISNGQNDKAILNIVDGQKIGTFFTKTATQGVPVDVQAVKARDGSRILQRLSAEQRKTIIQKMASNLIEHSKDILLANKRDLEEAKKDGKFVPFLFVTNILSIAGLKSSLLGRLGLSEKKLKTLATGLEQIAEKADVLGRLPLSSLRLLTLHA